MSRHPVLVVGAGVGGMAAALMLAARGQEVLVLEAQPASGGKLRQVVVAGQGQDAGPTVFTMRWVFDELFASAGEVFGDCVGLQRAGLLARHAWNDQTRLDLHADPERTEQAIGQFAGPTQARLYRRFCVDARRTYQTLEHAFLRATRPSPVSLAWRAGLRGLPGLMRMGAFRSLWDALGPYFPDPRLRQLFGRYATYCGSSPFRAPATLMLVAHVEQSGVWCLDGGMASLAAALESALHRKGVQLRHGCRVERVLLNQGRACGVALQGGESIAGAAVVFNGDAAALADGMLGTHPVAAPPSAERSLSAITWNLVSPARGFPLARHNVFFSGDYRREFDELADGRLAHHPTVYVCAHDRGDDALPPGLGAERLMCLVNAPALGDSRALLPHQIAQATEQVFDKLRRSGLRLYPQAQHTVVTTPTEFARLFPGTGGALYGQASHGWRASFRRPDVRAELPGLYLAGGSTHPGPGVPMAALSGRLAAECVLQDLEQAARGRRP